MDEKGETKYEHTDALHAERKIVEIKEKRERRMRRRDEKIVRYKRRR